MLHFLKNKAAATSITAGTICFSILGTTAFAESVVNLGDQIYSDDGWARAITGQQKFDIGSVEMGYKLEEHEFDLNDCKNFLHPRSSLYPTPVLLHTQTPLAGYPKFVKDHISVGIDGGGTVLANPINNAVGYEGKITGFTDDDANYDYWGMERKERMYYTNTLITKDSSQPDDDGGPFKVTPVSTPPSILMGNWATTTKVRLCYKLKGSGACNSDAMCEESEGETNANCPSDCMASSSSSSSSAPFCGDALCNGTEDSMTCPTDCF